MRRPVLDHVLAGRALDHRPRGGALRAEAAARDRAVGIALDLGDPAILDVDPLAAADGAERADRLDGFDPGGPRLQSSRSLRSGCGAAAGRVVSQLPQKGEVHRRSAISGGEPTRPGRSGGNLPRCAHIYQASGDDLSASLPAAGPACGGPAGAAPSHPPIASNSSSSLSTSR